jgi:hypothetical protein
VRQTKQGDVRELLKQDERFKRLQLDLFIRSLDRINTKYICVLNAGASHHLCKYLNIKQTVSSYEHKGKTLFFSGMLSGQRVNG